MSFGYKNKKYTESGHLKGDKSFLPLKYSRYVSLSSIYPDSLKNMTIIGLGGGKTTSYMHDLNPELKVLAIELDEEVYRLAKKYFDFEETERLKVVIEDGRKHLTKLGNNSQDIIIIDAYRGPFVPFHLTTKEFYQLAEDKLREKGVLVQNIEPTTLLFDSTVKTIGAVFDNIDLFDAEGNVVAIAYNGQKMSDEELSNRASKFDYEFNPRHKMSNLLKDRKEFKISKDAKILTDDFAPVNALKAIKRYNEKWPEGEIQRSE
jgi:spermidine synthase